MASTPPMQKASANAESSRARQGRRATSIDVAELAGVSQATVSRTFTQGASVAEGTRQKVREAAAQLGYQPNAIARSLITRQSNIIGIVMGNIASPFHPYVLELFIKRFQELGQQVLLFSTDPDEDVDEMVDHVLRYQVDGLIITSATISSAMADACARQGTPVVLFNRYVLGANVNAVCCDNAEAGRLVANVLLDAGHRRPAYIAGRPDASTNIDRFKGFSTRLLERGVIDLPNEPAGYSYEAGYQAALRLLARESPPDAVFCASDIAALGAMDAARSELGLRIPEDLSIIGFDDIPSAAWPAYALTTIRTPVNRMIEATIDILLSQRDEPVFTLIPGALIQRSSARLPVGFPNPDPDMR